MDIVFLFRSLAAGIVIGAGMIPLCVLGSVLIGGVLLVVANRKGKQPAYLLLVHGDDGAAEDAGSARHQTGRPGVGW